MLMWFNSRVHYDLVHQVCHEPVLRGQDTFQPQGWRDAPAKGRRKDALCAGKSTCAAGEGLRHRAIAQEGVSPK